MWTWSKKPVATHKGVRIFKLTAFLPNLVELKNGRVIERKPIVDRIAYAYAGGYPEDSKEGVIASINFIFSRAGWRREQETEFAALMNKA